MSVEQYNDDGLINLAEAIIEQARNDYINSIECGDYIHARVQADKDKRGLVGMILQYVTDDDDILDRLIDKEIFSQLKKGGD